ncbi:unnamed protein product [Protopolystoma xenopodis]|uniref:Uncharacterized protein n=1 Tax=Protopolystoma xenopodis TaxID=117903 RepID=A0A448WKW5_9PLAT|nr:unnamed protein product [Protopolystoma xenopodis]
MHTLNIYNKLIRSGHLVPLSGLFTSPSPAGLDLATSSLMVTSGYELAGSTSSAAVSSSSDGIGGTGNIASAAGANNSAVMGPSQRDQFAETGILSICL